MARFNRYCYCILFVTLGLIFSSKSYAFYDGSWTRFITKSITGNSVIYDATARLTRGNITRTFTKPVVLSAGRVAKLATGFLRFTAFGLGVAAAMEAVDYYYDNETKSYVKTLESEVPVSDICTEGLFQYNNLFNKHVILLDRPFVCESYAYISECLDGYGMGGTCTTTPKSCVGSSWCIDSGGNDTCAGQIYYDTTRVCTKLVPVDDEVTKTATDRDILDIISAYPDLFRDLIQSLPSLFSKTSTEMNKSTDVLEQNVPEITDALDELVDDLNDVEQINDAVDQVVNENVDYETLPADQIEALEESDIDIDVLSDALEKVINGEDLTPAEQAELDKYEDINTQVVTDPDLKEELESQTQTQSSTDIEIPTDCELIPFVCDWLDWFKNWMIEPLPEIPQVPDLTDEMDQLPSYSSGLGSGSCPSPQNISVFSNNIDVSYQPFCDFAILINPLVLAAAWLMSAFIIVRSK